MKNRFWLFKRDGVFYLQDAVTRKKESLRTEDRREAERIRNARNDAAEAPSIGFTLAKAYLSAYDPRMLRRTWTNIIDAFCSRGKESTTDRRQRAIRSKPYDLIRNRKLIATTADDLRAVIKAGGVFTNHFLRCLHNLAVGLGWLPWPIIPSKLWPEALSKPKRGISREEHEKVIQSEQNRERKLFYEILWEIGASQSDAAALTADNLDWQTRTLSYERKKTGECAYLCIGQRLELLLRQLPSSGPLFAKIGQLTNKDRAAEFRRRCRLLKIEGVSLHSYRYAWAERARTCGYPERFAQEALGHNSKAVHRAYAKKAIVSIPALDEYEQRTHAERKIIPVQLNPEG